MKLKEAKFTLQKQFDESTLQDEALRTEGDFGRREDNLKRQLTNYQSQLEESEQRNHDLGQSIQSATRPLLRQIENLQSTNSSQAANFEALEKSFQTRIEELQEQVQPRIIVHISSETKIIGCSDTDSSSWPMPLQ